MFAAYYEQNGPANAVLKLGEGRMPRPGPGEVRVRLATSGVNPSDVKARSARHARSPIRASFRTRRAGDRPGGRRRVDRACRRARLGVERQWLRPFGTCAEYIVLPAAQAVPLGGKTSFEVGACLGIPAMTAYHAIAVAGAAPE